MRSASLITGRPTVPKPFFSSAFLICLFRKYIQILTEAISNVFHFCFSLYTALFNFWRRKAIIVESGVVQSCPTLCDPVDCSPPGSSVHGIFQAVVLEWAAISFSRGSSWPRDQTQVSHIVDRCFTIWATRENYHRWLKNPTTISAELYFFQ